MKPVVTTMLMAVIAFATSAAAWYFYPRIEVQREVVRSQLLTEEEAFEPRDVRKVKIEQFDRSTNSPTEFELRLDSGSWVIPGSRNYPANNNERVAAVVSAFRDREILETVSDNKDDHEEYGVLDISELGATGLGAGTVLTFEGRNRKKLARMIVGASPDGKPGQRYVRLAGQPQIYVIEFDSSVMTTTFSDWVDGSLIIVGGKQMTPQQFLSQVDHVSVDLYYQDTGGDATRKTSYRMIARQDDQNQWFYDLWKPDAAQQLPDEPTVANQPINLQTLSNLISKVFRVNLRNVARKQETAALDLAGPKPAQPASHFDSLRNFGFYHRGFDMGQHQFDSAAGEVTIAYRFGLKTRVNVGTLDVDVAGGGNINRYLMLTASVDPSLVPEPQKPDAGDADAESESAEGENQESADDRQRQYQAQLNQRKANLETANQLAKSFNQVHADWVYVVPDDEIQRLLPPADSWGKPQN